MSQNLTITAHSTALFSTWIFIEEWKLLFDAGDGVMSHLMHRARKIKNVALSHADRDHIFGLAQINHHDAGHGLEHVFYPRQARSIEVLRDFVWRFDRATADQYEWVGIEPQVTYPLSPGIALRPVRNTHLSRMGDEIRSVGYVVMRQFRKLKTEFESVTQEELRKIGTEKGSDFLSEPREEALLSYSGDTGVMKPDTWLGAKTLIHESTFLRSGEVEEGWPGHEHSNLDEVLPMARDAAVERLVLHHLSTRYSIGEIVTEIRRLAGDLKLGFPVWAIPPGETVDDVFSRRPVWEPS